MNGERGEIISLKKALLDKPIDCPRCWVEAERKEVKGFGLPVIIDVCPKCGGIWLDTGELGKLLKDRKLTDYLTKHIGTQSKSKLVCPRCGGLMDLEMAEDVEIDVCLSCNGAWLDRGELDRLKDKSREGYKGDTFEKAVERWEENVEKEKHSLLSNFLRRLSRL